jgi:NADH-quinone oxidoreductase subunit F
MWEILDDISKGEGDRSKLQLLAELATVVKDTSMCGLGQSAANPVLSTLRYFMQEYERHLIDKRCDAFVCRDLVGAPCQSACPVGTEAWRYVAHIGRGEYQAAYQAIRQANPFPSVCARVCDHSCEERCRAGQSGGDPIAIRALKRFITDRIDPSTYQPQRTMWADGAPPRIAIIGAGPAGLTSAHYLSLKGYQVTVFESEKEPGGMLYCAIPAYRLPKETIRKEIDSLLDQNITVRCGQSLGKDITIDGLLADGYQAILLAMGAHKSKLLEIENEDVQGIYPSIEFLKAFNLRNENWAKGRVGVIGGGNSAIDAARTAVRQNTVDSVTILYRRTRHEMPAFTEEIEAAEQEGIRIDTLITPKRIIAQNGKLSGLECLRNELGEIDAGGRRKPLPIPGSEYVLEFDTLIVAISEDSGKDCISAAQHANIETTGSNTVKIDQRTLSTSRAGIFAAGDVTTGPNTVIDAIAAGTRAALMIDRYIRGESLEAPAEKRLPSEYLAPLSLEQEDLRKAQRVDTPRAPADWRKRNFAEVEVSLSVQEASGEARRCLRCDLEFTQTRTQDEEELVGSNCTG